MPQQYKFAFTSRAFLNAVDEYCDFLFSLNEPMVLIDNLCTLPEIKYNDVSHSTTLKCIVKNWRNIKDIPPWGMHPQRDELKIMAKLNELYPDNVKIVYSTLEEYLFLNRVFGNDELLNITELWPLLKKN